MPQTAFVIAGCLASFLPAGHMAALFYAERLIEFPLGVTGTAVGIAATPALARLAADKGTKALRVEAERALRLSLALNLPAAAGLAAVAFPLAATLFGHGAFNERAVHLTVQALWGYAPGLPAYALSRPLLALCQVTNDGRTPLRAALIGLIVTFAGAGTLAALGCSAGPAAAVSAGLWCNTALLWRGAAVRTGISPHWRFLARQIALSGLTFGTAAAVVSAAATLRFSSPLALLLSVCVGLIAHLTLFPRKDRKRLFRLYRKL